MNKNLPVDNIAETSIPFPTCSMLFFLTAEMFPNHCLQNKAENLRTERKFFHDLPPTLDARPCKAFLQAWQPICSLSNTHWSFSSPCLFQNLSLHMPFVLPIPPQASQLLLSFQFHLKDALLWEVCPRCPPATLVLPSSWLFVSSMKAFPVALNNEVYSLSDLPLCLFG